MKHADHHVIRCGGCGDWTFLGADCGTCGTRAPLHRPHPKPTRKGAPQ
jgi:hypothetical protein